MSCSCQIPIWAFQFLMVTFFLIEYNYWNALRTVIHAKFKEPRNQYNDLRMQYNLQSILITQYSQLDVWFLQRTIKEPLCLGEYTPTASLKLTFECRHIALSLQKTHTAPRASVEYHYMFSSHLSSESNSWIQLLFTWEKSKHKSPLKINFQSLEEQTRSLYLGKCSKKRMGFCTHITTGTWYRS